MPLKVNFTVPNKAIHILIDLAIIAILAAGAYAWVIAVPPLAVPDPGHALNTIQGYFVGDASLRDTLAKLQQSPAGGMSCLAGNSIRSIDIQGNVQCEADDTGGGITSITAGNGLSGGGAGPIVPLAVDTGVAATTGLEIVADQIRLMDDGCAAGEVLKRNAANNGWECVAVALDCTTVSGPSSGIINCPAGYTAIVGECGGATVLWGNIGSLGYLIPNANNATGMSCNLGPPIGTAYVRCCRTA